MAETPKTEAPKHKAGGFGSLDGLLKGLGAAGKFAVEQALLNAATDTTILDRVAQEMFVAETRQKWPPPDAAAEALWKTRATNAIIGVRFYIKGK